MIRIAVFISLLISCTGKAICQLTTEAQDTSYYESYTDLITARFYFSQKYTSLVLKGTENLQYRPNTSLNTGVGFSYGWFTANAAVGLPFLNQGDDGKGKTSYLDLQSHIYPRKYCIDLLGQFYRSFYLYPKGIGRTDNKDWYVRPDLKVMHLGISAYRILNWKKFSFRAGMLQNEWQKKSAGSFLVGAEAYYGRTDSDSAIVPSQLEDDYTQRGVTSIRYIDLGPGIGYAYTLVIAKNFFILGSGTATLPIGWLKEKKDGQEQTKFSATPNFFYRLSTGYNNARWSISLWWVNNVLDTKGVSGKYRVNTGNVRLTTAYRFAPGPRLKKPLRLFELK